MLPSRVEDIEESTIKNIIKASAQQAWHQSLAIAAKDEYLKDKMETSYYEDLLLELLLKASQDDELRNCHQIFFTYFYTPFEFGSQEDRQFKTRLLFHAVDDQSGQEMACELTTGNSEIFLCLDETRPTGGAGGTLDDDD